MLTLIVSTLDGRPLATELRGKFGVLGGTIGAIEGNTIVLDDPQGRVAALEANVIASPGGFVIRNCGASPLFVNGSPVATGAEAPIPADAEIAVGPFVLRVAPAAPASAAAASAGAAAAPVPVPAATTTAAVPAPAAAAPQPAPEALQRALLEGLGVPNLDLPGGLNPELMRTLGEVLREVTQGTIDLLRLRAEAKSRMHANMTMVGSREVNPLKAAWDAGVALQHLLAPQRTDMLDPLQAMTDAYDDLRRHDRGLVAGIDAALAGLLERFDPAELEKRLGGGGRFDSMMPGGAKAKRWDALVELYADLSVEAEQDFWSLFDKEFLKAYEGGSGR